MIKCAKQHIQCVNLGLGGSTRWGESTTTLKPYSLFITLNSFRLWHNISLINCFIFTLKQFATIHYQKTISD